MAAPPDARHATPRRADLPELVFDEAATDALAAAYRLILEIRRRSRATDDPVAPPTGNRRDTR